jgi:hypothetical protein
MSTQAIRFDEPGGHLLALLVTDQQGREIASTLPVRVVGGEALSAEIRGLPETAKPRDEVSVSMEIRGGVMVVNGQKAGYTVRVDWGDGGEPAVMNHVGTDSTPAQGATIQLTHSFAKTGDYTVRVQATDATHTFARDSRQITIEDAEEAKPLTAPTASGPNAAPKGLGISVSTEQDTPVDITLSGTDPDGDDLTYRVVRDPANGTLTGSPPLLTYTPNPGFWGNDNLAYKVNDGRVDSLQAFVSIRVTRVVRWIRDGAPIVNSGKAPLEFYGGGVTPDYFGEARYAGKSLEYEVSANAISMHERRVSRKGCAAL